MLFLQLQFLFFFNPDAIMCIYISPHHPQTKKTRCRTILQESVCNIRKMCGHLSQYILSYRLYKRFSLLNFLHSVCYVQPVRVCVYIVANCKSGACCGFFLSVATFNIEANSEYTLVAFRVIRTLAPK